MVAFCDDAVTTARLLLEPSPLAYLQNPPHLANQAFFFKSGQRFGDPRPAKPEDYRKIIVSYRQDITIKGVTGQAQPAR
jgi:hypothetical protein